MIDRLLNWLMPNKYLQEFERLHPPVKPLDIQDMDAWNHRSRIGVEARPVALSDRELEGLIEGINRGATYLESNDHNIYFTDTNRVILQIEEPITEETIRQYKGKAMTLVAINIQIKRQRQDELMKKARAIMNEVLKGD